MKLLNEVLSSETLAKVNLVIDKILSPRGSYVYDFDIDEDLIYILIDYDMPEHIESIDIKGVGRPEIRKITVDRGTEIRTAAEYQILLGSVLDKADEKKLSARLKKSHDKIK